MAVAKTHQRALANVAEVRPHHDTTAPTGWLLCNGASLLRTDYPELAAALSFTIDVNTSSGSSTVSLTGDTLNAPNGAWVEKAGSVAGTTIISGAGSAVSFVIGANASADSSGPMTVFPFGCADSTHFNVPLITGRLIKHGTIAGTRAGRGTVPLDTSHMPSHTHGYSDPIHDHGVTNFGTHTHPAGFAPFAQWNGTVNTASGTGGFYGIAYDYNGGDVGDNLVINCGPNNGAGMPATTGSTGTSNVAHSNIQPTLVATYIVRAFP